MRLATLWGNPALPSSKQLRIRRLQVQVLSDAPRRIGGTVGKIFILILGDQELERRLQVNAEPARIAIFETGGEAEIGQIADAEMPSGEAVSFFVRSCRKSVSSSYRCLRPSQTPSLDRFGALRSRPLADLRSGCTRLVWLAEAASEVALFQEKLACFRERS